MAEVIFMDLQDFVPEEYEIGFSIRGHRYLFKWGEASVDDMVRMMIEPHDGDIILRHRTMVVNFLKKYLVEGDALTLEADMKDVPYESRENRLSILWLLKVIQGRVKKNDLGAIQERTREAPRGSAATSPS